MTTQQKGTTLKKFFLVLLGIVIGAMTLGGGIALADTAGGPWDNGPQDSALAQQNADTKHLIETQPAPLIKYSVERQNLINRYKTYSDKNKISYIALVNQQGGVLYTGVVKGKVSSASSQLTPEDRMTCTDSGEHGSDAVCATIKVPEPDGSWSTNGEGVFWFDDTNVYHEWNGLYLIADQAFTLTQPPLLSIAAEAK